MIVGRAAVAHEPDEAGLDRGDAAVLRVKGTSKGLALTADVNPRYCLADPMRGAAHAVAESARNVAATGARPLAITNCLNFGDPERYWELCDLNQVRYPQELTAEPGAIVRLPGGSAGQTAGFFPI